ncbi:bacillithiol biosynthesis cysteine-adding enzyme BshC [Bacillus altitudinis]|uniref:bacillithiol biosynthesis cysteine-adding enzyme BshC n=1 Tax=Bacillus altitudinis TaxID=293387 RepID=UPI0002FD050A|nr:bacillithiol biosynthesis cysteine-adding enzyme BshC [Bacillus altitudinis]QAR54024.1 bacillithiol biosynthesis cysteine-adding enzyme BshC [Bacillus aerophilus]SIT82426.1 bacillithiol biosynthesis cysteine-adding enzyme BshC [Bacillus altitudinis]
MQLTELSIRSQNLFIRDYIEEKKEMTAFFDYDIHSEHTWKKRYDDLMERSFPREALADYMSAYHATFDSAAMRENIEKIRDERSVMVVGGQQAGLLAGPLYTIHKIISIIQFAKEKESELGVPVIPVFWVAGEDHDVDEINFVYTSGEKGPVKQKLPLHHVKKTAAKRTPLHQEKTERWLRDVFSTYEESAYTNDLFDQLLRCLRKSETFTDFFEWIVCDLFEEDGLLLLNSGDFGVKPLERTLFKQIVESSDAIVARLNNTQAAMKQAGYQPIIEAGDHQANLFYEYDDERFLIEKENGQFSISEVGLTWTKDELLQEVEEHPERFSNNVVTRPLMQETLLPTLAFMAGHGEVNYWGELKGIFEYFDVKMAPVLPRLHVTILERHIDKKLPIRELSVEEVLTKGVKEKKDVHFQQSLPDSFVQSVQHAKRELANVHEAMRQEALEIEPSFEQLLDKNAKFIEDQLQFVYQKVAKRVEEKEGYILRDFERIENSLKPLEAPQERIWNIMYFLNKYGPEFFKTFKNLPFSFQNKQQIVKL